MRSPALVASPDTPFFDAVAAEHGWSPTELRAPFDVEATIAASYAARIRPAFAASAARPEPSEDTVAASCSVQ